MRENAIPYAFMKYVGHVAVMTGKTKEALDIDQVEDISGLLDRLDKQYPGFKEVFMPPGGIFNSRTGIILRRANGAAPVIDKNHPIQEGDVLTFW